MRNSDYDVTTFGAKGDGKTDDTAAIQKALDAAAEKQATVHVPEGIFMCSTLTVHPYTGLAGNPTWGYRHTGGSILRLNDANATCLVDITGAIGATLNGLSIDGAELGDAIHGIHAGMVPDKKEEDSPRIERCKVCRFSGHGIKLFPIWCFSIRGCMIGQNKGDGIHVGGWDGFILDNWLSGNQGAGYCAEGANAAITMTGNRIEWNRNGGVRVLGGNHYNVTGNYIDRSGGPGICFLARDDKAPATGITITGNVIYRSGKPEWISVEHDSCHLRFEGAHGLSCVGNTMCVGTDDGDGLLSPDYGIVVRALKNCVIKDNSMHIGVLKELLVDLGEHGEGVIIKDNVGSVYTDAPKMIWESDQR